ncbi:MAG: hypothetical protein NZ869_01785 [Thermoanaerobaculum sp.]|nr:hypothetical protein [Thermoanaerobaculum sp.]MDW7967338.1 hypothetical protein [Thermoanaerobaculum sp.]
MTTALWLGLLLGEGLVTLDGSPFSWEAFAPAQPKVVVFWNSWVPQDPAFPTLVAELERRGLAAGLAGAIVIFQEPDGQKAATVFGSGRWPRLLDRRGVLVRQFGLTQAPMVVLLGPRGEVEQTAGPDMEGLRRFVASLGQP